MIIRKGDLKDLNASVLIETSYTSDYVWQIRTEERPYEEIAVNFHAIRLPRSVRARPPRDTDCLVEDWQRGECFLVAEEEGEIRGCLNMTVQPWHATGWINDMAVPSKYRRQGIGSELLRNAFRWAREQGLRSVLLETQTKNHPAICFCRKHGFVFCGFKEPRDQDPTLFWCRRV